jgi:chromatin modification-related protein VID21
MGDEGESSKHMGASITIGEQIESAGESRLLGRRMQPTPERRLPGMTRDKSKDLMFSQRPPMRIDTGVSSLKSAHETYEKIRSQASADAQSPPSSITPVKATPTTAHASPPERMTTRVSSGALRHKSVSEILGETPRTATHHTEKTPVDKGSKDMDQDSFSKHGQLVASPDSMTFRSRLSEMKEREKERSKLSTVIFALQQHHDSAHQSDALIRNVPDPEKHSNEPKDYLQTLFTAQCSAQQPSLNGLLASAHKTLSTANHYIDFHEQQDCRILKRIYHLQNSNRWSLRQLERSQEPSRPATHWDAVLGHMKWMQTDFREERKWKLVAAKNLADWCAEWVLSSVSRRASMQVRKPRLVSKVKLPENQGTPVSLFNGDCSRSETTPELMLPTEDNMSEFTDDSISQLDIVRTPAPAAVFSLAPDDVIFTLERTPLAEKLLDELPLYRPLENLKDLESKIGELDKGCKAPLVPISKFTNGKMVLSTPFPPRKRSRYDYEGLDDPLHNSISQQFARFDHDNDPLPPELQDVALFNPENKHIIDRLHAAHAFRPPSEFSMPSQSFFESRNCSQWTWNEDDELRRLVKEYAYNWSLISSCLRSPSLHSSGAERRTPWECFERWVSFEGLPGDMGRTQYFRTWYARRDAAKALMNQQMAAQQQQPGSGASQAQVRRRTAEPIRVDRRRNSKHLALFDAMRKVAKKKETALQKQQHGS